MLTDDDLSRQLGGAFRDASGDLQYAGRVPAPRSAITTVGVPLASSAAVVAALAVVWASASGTDDAVPPTAGGPTASVAPTTPTAPRLVTEKVEVAGFTFSYRHAAGDGLADDLYGDMHVTVPADAKPVDAPEGVKAWVGVDPDSGDHAIYVDAPTRNGGEVFALLSPTWTEDQLVDLFHNGRPRPAPAVS
ncbi:hypothetical protein [Nocardioides conyzicola]|uniref:DUF4245 domain-containing protein n=1 Tax=Nocardioides conyzicola TaxID=1651781 RepID=A0ABP8X9T7_9ACTN